MKTKIKLISALLIMLSFNFYCVNIKVFLVVNDINLSSEDIKKMADYIYFKNKIKVNSFTVLHFSSNKEEPSQWKYKKKVINYKPTKIDCNFSICDNLTPILKYEKGEKTKFYNCERILPCNLNDFGLEITNLSNKNESTIIEKIIDESELNKKNKKDLVLFFYISGNNSTIKPTVSFPTDSIIITEMNSSITLDPKYNGKFTKYIWEPQTGLSCSDCKFPKVSIQNRTIYSVYGIDSSGCKSNKAEVLVAFRKQCSDGYGKCEILFGTPEKPISTKFEHKERSKTINYDWKIHANQSGSSIYEIVTKPNCGSKFRVRIYDKKGKRVWEENYERADVDSRGGSNYHKIFPSKFAFKLNLFSIIDIIKNENEREFIIEIESFDENNNTYEIYKSPKIYFSNC